MICSLTCAQVHSGEQRAHPRRLALALAIVGDELAEEDAERVSNAVDDHVAHEGGEHDDPAVAAVGGRRHIVVLAVTQRVLVVRLRLGLRPRTLALRLQI